MYTAPLSWIWLEIPASVAFSSRESWNQRLASSSWLLSQTFNSHTGVDLGLGGAQWLYNLEGSLQERKRTQNYEYSQIEALKRTTEGHHWLHDTVTQKQGSPLVGCRAKRHSEAKDQEKEGLISCSK